MADLVIRGMEMPKDGRKHTAVLQFLEDGKCRAIVEYSKSYDDRSIKVFEAVPLPYGHGRLIDADVLYEVAKTRSMGIYGPCDFQCVITGNDILKAHTIVPSGGGEDG